MRPYEFAPDPDLSDLDLLRDVHVGVPVRIEKVASANVLVELAERMPMRDAFHTWARVVLGVYGADDLERECDTIAAELSRDLCSMDVVERRALFKPLIAQGLTLREIATRVELPLALVVRYSWSPRAEPHAEGLADAEEAIMREGCPINVGAFAWAHGIVPERDQMRAVLACVVADQNIDDATSKIRGDPVEDRGERRRGVVRHDQDTDPLRHHLPLAHQGRPATASHSGAVLQRRGGRSITRTE